ncbi:PQQ-dependent sugar dehydrogenase [Sphingomonas arantia]|uniref:PQQ-dependent sugar dehydrogenase n=1 Tax=Sphingomonas arantia TaxID=1460676 RepID=A0ABW4TYL2_9SPHN
MRNRIIAVIVLLLVLGGGLFYWLSRGTTAKLDLAQTQGTKPEIPEPTTSWIPTVNIAPAVGWKAGEAPTPAAGLAVNDFAAGLDHPRWMLLLPNGDVLVAETNKPPKPGQSKSIREWVQSKVMGRAGAGVASPNRIVLLRDADGDGIAESRSTLLTGLMSPFGMALVGNQLYVANADALVRYPFTPGQTKITAAPTKVVDLPGGPINHHWTKNVIASPDGKRLFVTIGSNSNVGENGMAAEEGRAAIWEVDPATGNHRIYAYGLRNPNGLAYEPQSKQLFTVVNERDELGSDMVPDYLTHVEFGGFYGWPYYYWGGYIDKRVPPPEEDMRQYSVRPDYALGPHTASLGLTFADGAKLGDRFANGAFIGQHGSWNRKPMSGYKVVYVPFVDGRPTGKPVDVLTGFLSAKQDARGRPVGVIKDKTGALLVADDVGNRIWRVSAAPAVRTATR